MIGNAYKKHVYCIFPPVHFKFFGNCIYFIMNKTDFNSEQNFDRQWEKGLQLFGVHESLSLLISQVMNTSNYSFQNDSSYARLLQRLYYILYRYVYPIQKSCLCIKKGIKSDGKKIKYAKKLDFEIFSFEFIIYNFV